MWQLIIKLNTSRIESYRSKLLLSNRTSSVYGLANNLERVRRRQGALCDVLSVGIERSD